MKIIAFTGAGGAGKNTAAQALGKYWHTEQRAFAAPLYTIVATLLGFTTDDVEQFKKDGSKMVRHLLESIGDWTRKELGEDFLINRMRTQLTDMENSQDTPELAVITDLRTEDEAYWVRAMKGLVIHVSRPEGTSDSQHSTNQPITLAQGDQYLLNNGTEEDLAITACAIVRAWIIANRPPVTLEQQGAA
jgi:hypothetical protein